MPRSIFLLQGSGQLLEMKEQPYELESKLQDLLAGYPDLLSGEQVDNESPRRWLFVGREVPVPSEHEGGGRWSLDHLFLDQDGIPTLVEVKRSSDPRIRREVVGQMLDYAANARLYWPVEKIREFFEAACESRNRSSEQELNDFLRNEIDSATFWQNVKTNLQAGRIRLLFVADRIPQELKRIIEFLNEQMDPAEVLGLEIRQFASEKLTTLVPGVVGQTAEAQGRKAVSGGGERWTPERFLQALEKGKEPEDAQVAERVLQWARKPQVWIYWGTGRQLGYFVPQLTYKDRNYQFFQVRSDGKIDVPFYVFQNKPPFDSQEKRLLLLSKLNSLLVEKLASSVITKCPSISMSELRGDKLQGFLQIFDWFRQEVEAT